MAGGPGMEKERISIHVARLKKGGANFEIDIDFDAAMKFKEGKADIKDVLKAEKIFSDAKKGMEASETQMKQLFETSDPPARGGCPRPSPSPHVLRLRPRPASVPRR